MFKYVILVLALVAIASAQLIYGGYSGANLHGPFAASANTGIRRGLPTGFISTGYIAPGYLY